MGIRNDLTVLPELGESAARSTSDLDSESQALIASRRVPQSPLCYVQPPAAIAWRTIPSTYAVCTNDMSLPVEFQRSRAMQATEVVEIPTGHLPMLVRPDLVADLLARLASARDRAP